MERKLNFNQVEKALYIIDMNNGFVNFGAMANPKYNDLVPEQNKINTYKYYKNCINGTLTGDVQKILKD